MGWKNKIPNGILHMPNSQNQIVHRIIQVRGVNIILDKDIAPMYGVSTKALNQAVKRNSSRFPDTFMFRLTNEEAECSRSHFVTLNIGSTLKRGQNIKYNPFAFTEMGVAMLSSILKSDIAIAISIEIIEVFTELRKSNQQSLILTNRMEKVEKQLLNHELKLDKILQNSVEPAKHHQGIFFNNQIFDAYAFCSDLIKSAKKSIALIDNYIDESTLLQLSKRKTNVTCVIYTERITPEIKLDLEKHNAQYSPIEIRILKNTHDRFLIIDNKELYHLGASMKDLGKRWFAFSRMDGFLNEVLSRLG